MTTSEERSASPRPTNARPWREIQAAVKHRDQYQCVRCGSRRNLEVDHVVELHEGGDPTDMANLQVLCRGCNRAKHNDKRRGFSRTLDARGFPLYPNHPLNQRHVGRVSFL